MLDGSSPRVRGKPRGRPRHPVRRGLIPACAGKTRRTPARCRRQWAHPRVCGENFGSIRKINGGKGSSPRVRGKRVGAEGRVRARRLIPACAGKTRHSVRFDIRCTAHPRVCGENRSGTQKSGFALGSSPRVRGKLERCDGRRGMWRLIPACAGKTLPPRPPYERPWAHPRVCGENADLNNPQTFTTGSSPRVRGKLEWPCTTALPPRLIPACAGKTQRPRSAT